MKKEPATVPFCVICRKQSEKHDSGFKTGSMQLPQIGLISDKIYFRKKRSLHQTGPVTDTNRRIAMEDMCEAEKEYFDCR